MKVKVSGVMTKEIKKKTGLNAQLVKLTVDEFKRFVDFDLFRNETDYDYAKGIFKAIKIVYPSDYYAMPQYITTRDLIRCFKESDKTYDGFFNAIYNNYQI